jgi:hypothetical protein
LCYEEKLKLNSEGGGSGTNKYKRGYGSSYDGIWSNMESGDLFCVGTFDKNVASSSEDLITFNLLYKEM